jgi:hypothetical protein
MLTSPGGFTTPGDFCPVASLQPRDRAFQFAGTAGLRMAGRLSHLADGWAICFRFDAE